MRKKCPLINGKGIKDTKYLKGNKSHKNISYEPCANMTAILHV